MLHDHTQTPFARPFMPIMSFQELAQEFANFKEEPWPIANLLAPGLTLLTGENHADISLLALQLLMHVALGTQAFGDAESFQTTQYSVLYLALNSPTPRLRKLQSRFHDDRPDTEFDSRCHLTNTLHPLKPYEGLQALATWLSNNPDVRLLVIDNLDQLRHVYHCKERELIRLLRGLAEQQNIALLLLHTCKATSPLADITDHHLHLQPLNIHAYYRLNVIGSSMRAASHLLYSPPQSLQFYLASREDTLALTTVNGRKALSRERLKVLRLFYERGGELTPAEVAEALNFNPINARQILHTMVMARMLRTPSYGRYTIDPFIEPLLPSLMAQYQPQDGTTTAHAATETESAPEEEEGEEVKPANKAHTPNTNKNTINHTSPTNNRSPNPSSTARPSGGKAQIKHKHNRRSRRKS